MLLIWILSAHALLQIINLPKITHEVLGLNAALYGIQQVLCAMDVLHQILSLLEIGVHELVGGVKLRGLELFLDVLAALSLSQAVELVVTESGGV